MKMILPMQGVLALFLFAACLMPAPDVGTDGIHDPDELRNRKVHDFNKRLDSRSGSGVGSPCARALRHVGAKGLVFPGVQQPCGAQIRQAVSRIHL